MADTVPRAPGHTESKFAGFCEQVALVPGGIRVSGWAIRRQDNAPAVSFIFILNDFSCELKADKERQDVALMFGVVSGHFGFDAIVDCPLESDALDSLQIMAVWGEADLMLLPMLEVAKNGLSVARRQLDLLKASDGVAGEGRGLPETTLYEAEKYRKMYAHEGYRSSPGALDQAARFAKRFSLRAGQRIIDFGSGPGYASNFFHELGLRVIAVDIAANALREEFHGKFPLIVAAFWDLPAKLDSEWGICTDVMEHISTDKVGAVLEVIETSVRNAVLFNISLRHDGCGALINDVLHLTVRPRRWWEERLGRHWLRVEHVAGVENDWSCWVCSDRRNSG